MMTQQLRFSVLTAPLAAIDRRVLSQAWYSALHADRNHHDEGARTTPKVQTGTAPHAAAHNVAIRPASRTFSDPSGRATRCESRTVGPGAHDRRAERSRLARKIEETLLNPRTQVKRATFTVDGSGSRVAVSLQTRGSRVSLIAVCSPCVRTAVARALQEARFMLARRGIDVVLDTKEHL